MPRSTKKASERIFYRRVENWELWGYFWTAPSLVISVLMFFPLALIYQILSHS